MSLSIAEFISVLRRIRDEIYPEVNATYESALILKQAMDEGLLELNQDLEQFALDYLNFLNINTQVDEKLTQANNYATESQNSADDSALSATMSANSATIATNKSNEIKSITAQASTLTPGSAATASYNSIDGKLTFGIPAGAKGDKGDSFAVNSMGTTAQKSIYDAQPTGFSFLDTTLSLIYFKNSSTSGDWSSGSPFGKGDKGDTGDDGIGIQSIAFLSTTDQSGTAGNAGATDTYRITLTNATTYTFVVKNGIDLSNATPLINGTASAGSATQGSRADHIHPLPATLQGLIATLNELNFVGGVTSSIQEQLNNKLSITGVAADSSKLNGVASATTATANTIVKRDAFGYIYGEGFNNTLADTATAATHYYVETGSDGFMRPKTLANVKAELLASAALSGTPTAPTAAEGTNTTQVATTAFVLANSDTTTTTTVGVAIAGIAAGGIGSYVIAFDTNADGNTFGVTVAGSMLRPTDVNTTVNPGGTALAGTWKCMGFSKSGETSTTTLFLRIA